MNKTEILELLRKHKIDLSKWGVSEAKTLKHLVKEIVSGESQIISQKDGTLLRCTTGASVLVYYADGNRILKLKEEKQVFKGGRERVRTLDTPLGYSSVGEKMKIGEQPIEAARRAISEELCIKDDVSLVHKINFVKGPTPSTSYPGLMTKHVLDIYELFLPTHLYKPEGYMEEQEDKTNYFIWVDSW